jgi:hypothetical protein
MLRVAVLETDIGYSRGVLGGSVEQRRVRGQLPRWQCWFRSRLRLRLGLRIRSGERLRLSSRLNVYDNDLVRFAASLASTDPYRPLQLQSVILADRAVDEPAT